MLAFALLLSIVAGTAPAAGVASPPEAPAAVAGATTARPPATEGWLDDLAAARERAEREDKPILVDLWAAWCTWCKRLEQDVFSTPAFRQYAEGFVLLRVDTEDGGDGTRLMEDFEVASLPTTLLVTHDLIKIGELQGYAPAEPYLQSLQLESAMYAALVRAYDEHRRRRGAAAAAAESASSETADPLQTLADELHARRDGARAAELYRELLARGAGNAEESAWNRYYYADSLRLRHAWARTSPAPPPSPASVLAARTSPAPPPSPGSVLAWAEAREAVAAARAAAAAIDDDELHERIDLLPYYLARDAAACAEARQAIDRFVATHPDGVLLELAREEQRRIRSVEGCA